MMLEPNENLDAQAFCIYLNIKKFNEKKFFFKFFLFAF
jgi:hypothetical protein